MNWIHLVLSVPGVLAIIVGFGCMMGSHIAARSTSFGYSVLSWCCLVVYAATALPLNLYVHGEKHLVGDAFNRLAGWSATIAAVYAVVAGISAFTAARSAHPRF